MPAVLICCAGVAIAEITNDGAPAIETYVTHTVEIDRFKFVPAELTVRQGDHIIWINKDAVAHTATTSKDWDSGNMLKNTTWEYVADQSGTYPYICTYHPAMKGLLVVE